MKILRRYVAREVIFSTLMVLLVIVGVSAFISVVAEFAYIGRGEYTLLQALYYVVLQLPTRLYQLFPMACLIGSLLGLSRLAVQNELVVIRAAGVSLFGIVAWVLQAALLLLFVATLIGEGLAPRLAHQSEENKATCLHKAHGVDAIQHTWIKQGQRFIYVDDIVSRQRVNHLAIFDTDGVRLTAITQAARAVLQHDAVWQLQDVSETTISADTTQVLKKAKMPIYLDLSPAYLKNQQAEPSEDSLFSLYRAYHYQAQHGLDASRLGLAFWQRVVQPLATLVMVLLAVPFVFGSLRSVTISHKLVVGVAVGLGFYLLNQFFGPISMVFRLPPFIAAGLPTVLFGLACVILLRRIHS